MLHLARNMCGFYLATSTIRFDKSPQSYHSIRAFTAIGSIFIVLLLVRNMLNTIYSTALPQGVISDRETVARCGAMETQTLVRFEEFIKADLADNLACSICIENFNAAKPIR